jgi:excisionase family DNA binding protein
MTKLVLTVQETSQILGLSRRSTYNAIRDGSLPSVKVNGRWLVPKIQLDKFLAGELKTNS